MRRALSLLILALLPAALSAAEVRVHTSGEDDVLPLTAYSKTLDNGLHVIVVPTGLPNLVSVQIPVLTGSRNEVEAGKSGFAHFFEHMMFRGTENFTSEQWEATMTRAGARRNAYTSDDLTNYHATFAKENLEEVLMIEADRFQNLAYSEEDFKTEARAVLGEYNKNSANPIRKLLEVQRASAFSAHPYSHTTMGFIADIEDMPNQFDYSKVFFQRWYRPETVAVIVAGDVDPDEVFPLVETYWSDWQVEPVDTPAIPPEPAPAGPVAEHVDWEGPGLPYVSVAFHSPPFSTQIKDSAALDMVASLYFGETSDLYKRLVEAEQKADQLFPYYPDRKDPMLFTVMARLKSPDDAVAVRDQILGAYARATRELVDAERLEAAKANARNGFVRTLDNTGSIAGILASYVSFERSYDTLNARYALYASLTPEDLQAAARRYFTDAGLVLTTLSPEPLAEGIGAPAALASYAPQSEPVEGLTFVELPSQLPLVDVKLLFTVGSAYDPPGKEGLAALAASMIADAGSKERTITEINRALYPMAGSFSAQVDKEMTAFTGVVPAAQWSEFLDLALPQLLEPGFRADDFARIKDQHKNALVNDLRTNNEEELGKEALQASLYRGTRYAHPPLGTVAGLESITLEEVEAFVAQAYSRDRLSIGLAGAYPEGLRQRLAVELGALPATGDLEGPGAIEGRQIEGREVEIIAKETRAVAVSFGHPLTVTRSHPDFPALWLARAWLGEHRSALSHLYQRIREVRGMNYGDYAYIEAFPRGMFQFFPDANLGRRAQLFEIWIRPVPTIENAHMALRIAIHELETLVAQGLSEEDFEQIRNYISKNVFVMTADQDQQIGYALDSEWYGIPEYTSFLRGAMAELTVDEVNAALRRHFDPEHLAIVMIAQDAQGLAERLAQDTFSAMEYEGEKPAELLAEDQVIGGKELGIPAERITIVPVAEVFAE